MSKKRFLITALVLVVLAGLVYLQVRAWKKFDWHRFWVATHNTNKFYLVAGVALVYADYILRAMRWKIMLRPVCEAKTADLVAPTMIGFAGLALLGRPGEFIRPYLISRKVNLSMASQLAVWTVERIFDMGAFALIMAVNILWSRHTLSQLPGFANSPRRHFLGHEISAFTYFEMFALALLAGVCFVSLVAFRVRKNPAAASSVFVRLFGRISPKFGHAIGKRVLAFGEGLNTVKDMKSFFQLSGFIDCYLAVYRICLSCGDARLLHPSALADDALQRLPAHCGQRCGRRVAAASRRRRLTVGDDRHAPRRFQSVPRAGYQLRHHALAGDVYVRYAGRAGDGAVRTCIAHADGGSEHSGRREVSERRLGGSGHLVIGKSGHRKSKSLTTDKH